VLQNVPAEKVEVPKRKRYKTFTSQSTYYSHVLTFCDVHVLERLCFESVRFGNCMFSKKYVDPTLSDIKIVWRIRNVYPGSRILIFYSFRIPYPKIPGKDSCQKEMVCNSILYSHKFSKTALLFEILYADKRNPQFLPNY
jgi:hypothetical protein